MRVSRRELCKWGALSGAAFVLRVPLLEAQEPAKRAGSAAPFAPNKWLSIERSGKITLVTARSEMGQGARTSLAMILAEELGADWSEIAIVHATPGGRYPGMRTSGSSSVSDYWLPLRKAGAAAREMLREAAARTWGVPLAECSAENASVLHAKTGRRASYGELVALAATLPVPAAPPLKDAKDFRLLGTRVKRVDGPAIVTGRAAYGLDARPSGAFVAAVARSPVPGGRAASFDAAGAQAVPGVRDVVRLASGIAVVADDTWAALCGRDALKITWDEGRNHADSTATYWQRLETAARQGGRLTRGQGDFAQAWGSAARRLEGTYRYSFQAHAPVEPMNCFADVRDGRCEIRVGTQCPNEAQAAAAKLLGIPLEAVTLHVSLLGGGFGRRLDFDYVLEAVELSKAIGKPVQIVWSRRDDFENDRYQPASINELKAGVDASGKVVAWLHKVTAFHLTMFGPYAPNDDDTYSENPWGAYDTPYELEHFAAEYAPAESPVPTGAWRAVAYPTSIFARESFLDEVAAATGVDPVRLRLDLLKGRNPAKIGPYTIQRDRLAKVIELAAAKAGWDRPLPAMPNRRVGRGIAANVYHGRTHLAQVAEVSVGKDGDVRVHRVVCAVDCGQIVNLLGLEGQMESGIVWGLSTLKTRISFANGRIEQHTYSDYPVLRMDETPAIEVHVVHNDERPSGAGEQPVPPSVPAVCNAIFAATGKRMRRLPIQHEDLAV